MESVEIQKTDSHSSHRPWKSPGDSHIPSGPTILLILTTGDQTSFGKVSPMSPGHNVTYVPGRTAICAPVTISQRRATKHPTPPPALTPAHYSSSPLPPAAGNRS